MLRGLSTDLRRHLMLEEGTSSSFATVSAELECSILQVVRRPMLHGGRGRRADHRDDEAQHVGEGQNARDLMTADIIYAGHRGLCCRLWTVSQAQSRRMAGRRRPHRKLAWSRSKDKHHTSQMWPEQNVAG